MSGIERLVVASAVITALGLAAAGPASPQAVKAGVVTTVQGTATVARATATEPAPLKFRDDVFVEDRITTGEHSVARILLGGKAVVTVRERSELTISETATTSTLEVRGGKIALAVNKSRMRPGDSVEIKTPNAVAGVRGTVIIAEVGPDPRGTGVASTFTLLTGIVDVTLLDPNGRPTGAAVSMSPRQRVNVMGFTAPTAPREITRSEVDSIASEYRVNLREPSPGVNPQVTERQVQEASKHSAALLDDSAKGLSRGGKDKGDSGDKGDGRGPSLDRGRGGDDTSGGPSRVADRGLGGGPGDLVSDRKILGRRDGGGGNPGGDTGDDSRGREKDRLRRDKHPR